MYLIIVSSRTGFKAQCLPPSPSLRPTERHFTNIGTLDVFYQVDFNVPLDDNKNITNNQRIVGALPTIKHAISSGAKSVILMSHLGRPDGKKNDKFSLKPVVPELEKLLGQKVIFAEDCVGKQTEDIVNKADGGQVILLENLRFHAEEEGSSKDEAGNKVKADKGKVEEFRKGLTALGDIYISESTSFLGFHNPFILDYQWLIYDLFPTR